MDDQQFGFDLGMAARPPGALFDPAAIRADALALIAQARAATTEAHWDQATLRHNRIVFPHLVSWLPDEEERAQLCFDFACEAERIEQLLAA